MVYIIVGDEHVIESNKAMINAMSKSGTKPTAIRQRCGLATTSFPLTKVRDSTFILFSSGVNF